MAAIQTNLNLFAAEDWPLRFTIQDQDGLVKDLTNLVAVWVLKRYPEDTAEILRISGTVVAPASNGIVDVSVTVSQTLGLSGPYYWELQATLAGKIRKVAYGTITVRATGIRDAAPSPIPANYFGLHILNPNDVPSAPYSVCRATGQSWIHLEGDGVLFTIGTGIPGTYGWTALDDQLAAAVAGNKRLMYTTEKIPTFATNLTVAITDTVGTVIHVVSGAVVVNGGYIHIENEALLVTAGAGTTTLTVVRGQQSTTAATHINGTKVIINRYYDGTVDTGPPNAAGLIAWTNFCAALVQRYRGQIEAYELYNEPEQTWSGTMAEFITFTNVLHDAVRLYDSTALVITPATQTVSWMDGFWASGGTRDVDAVSFHGYPLLASPVAETLSARKVAPLKVIMATYAMTSKPIWDSEASWGPLDSLPGEDAQRAFLAIYYLLHWSLGVARFYWYSWDDTLDETTVGFGALMDANHTNTLGASIASTGTTAVTLAAGANVTATANGKFIVVDGEAMKISSGGGTTSLTVVRGQLGTDPATHANGHFACLLLAAAPAYWQVNDWMEGATMVIPATMGDDGTWTMVFSRAAGYQALAVWNSIIPVSFQVPGIYTKYRDLTGAITSVAGGDFVTVSTLPILFETS